MTLSTYHLPVIFPDEAVVLNYKGYQSPPQPKFKVEHYLKYPEGQSERVHNRWAEDAHAKALEFVSNNKRKDKILQGLVPSTNTVNRRNSKKPLYRSPEYMTAFGSQLYGGVVTTRQGQELLNEKLQQRIQSLNDLDSSAWGAPSKEVSGVLAPPSGLITQPIDDAFVSLSDAVQSGYISSTLLDALNRANSAIVQIGAYLTPDMIAEYIRINDSLEQSTQALFSISASAGVTALSGETKRILNTLLSGLKRQRKLLEDLNKKAYYSIADKKLLLEHSRSQLLPAEISKIRGTPSAVYGLEATQRAVPVGTPAKQAEISARSALARGYLQSIRAPPSAVSRESIPVTGFP